MSSAAHGRRHQAGHSTTSPDTSAARRMSAKALGATAALACGAAAAYYLYGPAEDDDDADDLPTVTPAECVQIMEKITMIMQQQINNLMRKIQAQGAQIPQQMLQSYLVDSETQQEVQSVAPRSSARTRTRWNTLVRITRRRRRGMIRWSRRAII